MWRWKWTKWTKMQTWRVEMEGGSAHCLKYISSNEGWRWPRHTLAASPLNSLSLLNTSQITCPPPTPFCSCKPASDKHHPRDPPLPLSHYSPPPPSPSNPSTPKSHTTTNYTSLIRNGSSRPASENPAFLSAHQDLNRSHHRRLLHGSLRPHPRRDRDRPGGGHAAAGDIQPCAGAGGHNGVLSGKWAGGVGRIWSERSVGVFMAVQIRKGTAPSWCRQAGSRTRQADGQGHGGEGAGGRADWH